MSTHVVPPGPRLSFDELMASAKKGLWHDVDGDIDHYVSDKWFTRAVSPGLSDPDQNIRELCSRIVFRSTINLDPEEQAIVFGQLKKETSERIRNLLAAALRRSKLQDPLVDTYYEQAKNDPVVQSLIRA